MFLVVHYLLGEMLRLFLDLLSAKSRDAFEFVTYVQDYLF